MKNATVQSLVNLLEQSITISDHSVYVHDLIKLRATISRLAEVSALGSNANASWARYLIRLIALKLNITPASIHDLYIARGKGELPTSFTVPAINLRALSLDAARAVFRAAKPLEASAIIFELARSEMGYTNQRPAEYASNILAAAIAEGYQGPVFIQGDHFQVSAKRYKENPDAEIDAVRSLTEEAIHAGFFNIDIDTSTLVDLSKPTVPEQQYLNTKLTAEFSALIRKLQPEGITISIGGEIGEVGGHNSTEEELRAFMDGYQAELSKLSPHAWGISKISIQTGTSHGGVVLPDGTIAQVKVDFDTLTRLSRIARQEYGLGGAVQHGASTLPEDAFGKFVESEAIEVHLATNFQNMLYDRLPKDLRDEMYAYLDKNHSDERKPGMTDEQFYYQARKRAIGPFKAELWHLSLEIKEQIAQAWEAQFHKLFTLLGVAGTKKYVDSTVKPVVVLPQPKFYLGEELAEEGASDLAD